MSFSFASECQSVSTSTAREMPELRLLLASPRGFCAGVRRAIEAVRDALALHGPPVYVRRPIVHNMEVVRTLEAEGLYQQYSKDLSPLATMIARFFFAVSHTRAGRVSEARRLLRNNGIEATKNA